MSFSPTLAAGLFAGTLYQAIAALIVFVALVVILKKAAWGPILKGLQDRENKIKGDLESAEKASAEAAQTLEAYQAELRQAQDESRRIIDQGRLDASKIAAQLKAETEADIRQLKERAERDIAAAREQAIGELYAQAAQLATAVASRILQREINPADQDRLVKESLAELGKTGRN